MIMYIYFSLKTIDPPIFFSSSSSFHQQQQKTTTAAAGRKDTRRAGCRAWARPRWPGAGRGMRGKRAAFQSFLRRHVQHLRLYPEFGDEEVVEIDVAVGPSHGINSQRWQGQTDS